MISEGLRDADADRPRRAEIGFLGRAQAVVADGRRLDDAVGYNFALVGDPGTVSRLSPASTARLDRLGAAVVADDSETVRDALARIGGTAMLVRPDRYLIGVASSPGEVEQLVARASAALLMDCVEPLEAPV